MNGFEEILKHEPYAVSEERKEKILKAALAISFQRHYRNCAPYRKFCQKRGVDKFSVDMDYEELPYLPVEIFKRRGLLSVPKTDIVQVLKSSATTSQIPSKVYIDNLTRGRQTKTLLWILADFLGNERLPFVVLGNNVTSNHREALSAQDAALRGFLLAATQSTFCSKQSVITQVLSRLGKTGKPFVILGYSFVLYGVSHTSLKLPQAKIIHFGGWKKLSDQKVTKEQFDDRITSIFGVNHDQIIDTYGFTEQLGIVYMDCPDGWKRCPLASQVLVRDPRTLEVVEDGQEGLLEFVTPLPHSYPGIAVLLDDIGRVISRGQCRCGRHGTAFEVIGRAKDSELRGCGDVAAEFINSRL